MKSIIRIIFLLAVFLLTSCNSIKLDYQTEESEKWKFELIEKILNNPKFIIKICDDTSLVTEDFKEYFFNITKEYYYILKEFEEWEFYGKAIIISNDKYKRDNFDYHFIYVEMQLPYKQFIYFTFKWINDKWKLDFIQLRDDFFKEPVTKRL
jgi:hypothetical protein